MSDSKVVSGLVRTAIIVSDLERSFSFYSDILGLDEVYFRGRLEDTNLEKLLGVPGLAQCDAIVLKAPGPALGMIGLFRLALQAESQPTAAAGIRVGETCLVFDHPDLVSLERRLRDAGYPVVCPPVSLRVSDQTDSLEMSFRDPDGVMINCIQRGCERTPL